MSLALNLLWLICGGLLMGCAWLLASFIMFVSIIGIPWGRAAFNIAVFTFFPFGNEAISRRELTGEDDMPTWDSREYLKFSDHRLRPAPPRTAPRTPVRATLSAG